LKRKDNNTWTRRETNLVEGVYVKYMYYGWTQHRCVKHLCKLDSLKDRTFDAIRNKFRRVAGLIV